MTSKKDGSKLMEALETALTKELKLVTSGVDAETDKPFTLTAKAKVWDRVLKLEAIKSKMDGAGWGSGFTEDDDK